MPYIKFGFRFLLYPTIWFIRSHHVHFFGLSPTRGKNIKNQIGLAGIWLLRVRLIISWDDFGIWVCPKTGYPKTHPMHHFPNVDGYWSEYHHLNRDTEESYKIIGPWPYRYSYVNISHFTSAVHPQSPDLRTDNSRRDAQHREAACYV